MSKIIMSAHFLHKYLLPLNVKSVQVISICWLMWYLYLQHVLDDQRDDKHLVACVRLDVVSWSDLVRPLPPQYPRLIHWQVHRRSPPRLLPGQLSDTTNQAPVTCDNLTVTILAKSNWSRPEPNLILKNHF